MQPGQIVFEITESEKVDNTEQLLNIVDFYRDAGFRIALDDLGAGYSSLNLLTELKPDFIKLDIQLIRNIGSDPYKSQIAAKLLELAGALNIETVAGGCRDPGGVALATGERRRLPPRFSLRPSRVPSADAPSFPRTTHLPMMRIKRY